MRRQNIACSLILLLLDWSSYSIEGVRIGFHPCRFSRFHRSYPAWSSRSHLSPVTVDHVTNSTDSPQFSVARRENPRFSIDPQPPTSHNPHQYLATVHQPQPQPQSKRSKVQNRGSGDWRQRGGQARESSSLSLSYFDGFRSRRILPTSNVIRIVQ